MDSYSDLSDKELLSLLSAGDEAAFAQIYKRYWKKVIAIGYHYTKDKAVAEEIVQEIFVGLWARRDRMAIDLIAAYLATAVKFSVFKYFYRQKRRNQLENASADIEYSTLTEQQIEARFTQEYIDGLVEQLPQKCKLVFKYSRKSELTIPEIAREMGIAEKTVESHLTKGLKMLRFSLRRAGFSLFFLLLFS